MIKVIYPDEQDELVKRAGQLSSFFEDTGQSMKKAASSAFSEKMIRENAPDNDHFGIHFIAMGSGEKYGCVSADTKIARPDGAHTPMLELQVTDTILSGAGIARKILHKFEYDLDTAYELDICGLPEHLIVSPSHPFWSAAFEQFQCSKDKYKRCLPPTKGQQNICKRASAQRSCALIPPIDPQCAYVETEQMRVGDFLSFKIPVISVPRDVSPLEARLIGYWLAEGCFERNNSNGEVHSWRLYFHVKETDLADKLKEATDALGLQLNRYNYDSAPNVATFTITGNPELAREHLFWFGEHALHKKIPLWMCSMSEEAKHELLTAYYEGDGHTESQQRGTATTASYDLACGIQRLLWSVNLPATVCKYFTPERDPGALVQFRGWYYRVVYSLASATGDLRFNTKDLLQTTKVHGFTQNGVMYLPIRGMWQIPWNKKIYTLEIETDHSYVSGGVHSKNSNKNGDFWDEDGLIKRHHTFVKNGHFFREHKNSDPKLAIGSIKASAWNDEMGRVELIIHGDKEKCPDIYERTKQGKEVDGSMSAKLPYDVCSICEKKAASSKNYCAHAKYHMTQWMPQFSKFAYVRNPNPTFFDFSEVKNRADRIARHLEFIFAPDEMQKAASTGPRFMFSDERATAEGIIIPDDFKQLGCVSPNKQRWLEKLATLEAAAESGHVLAPYRLYNEDAITESDMAKINKVHSGVLFRKLAKHSITLPLIPFAAYIKRQTLKQAMEDPSILGAQALMPKLFQTMQTLEANSDLENVMAGASLFKEASFAPGEEFNKLLHGMQDKLSVEPGHARIRIMQISITAAPRSKEESRNEKADLEKKASVLTEEQKREAMNLSRAYAMYKIAFCEELETLQKDVDENTLSLVLLQH